MAEQQLSDVQCDPVPHAVFTVDELKGSEKYDLWRESISCIFEVDTSKDVRSNRFSAKVDANMFGPLMLARTTTEKHDWHRSPSIMARDGMDHYMIQLFEAGTMSWSDRRGEHELPQMGLIIFDLAQEAKSRTNAFTNLSLIVPRDMLEDQLNCQDDQHLRVLTGNEPMVQLLRDHMLSLKKLSGRMTSRQGVEVAPATVGLAAACLNAAISDDPRQQAGVAMAQVTRIRRFVEANLSRPDLSSGWIAAQVGVSRTKLYELFDAHGGVANYVRDRRLRRALLALADPSSAHRSIYDVALECGYSSDNAFSRAFRSRYGVSPVDIRQIGAVAREARPKKGEVDRRYERWLNHLSL